MTPAISVDNLGKCYRVSHAPQAGSYRTLRESLSDASTRLVNRFRGRRDPKRVEDFWALKDVSFDVQPAEVVGIIGRNGAGKSTLLKILSRITSPTTGRVVLKGRVGSLLEVGTGFHPELTGRENIYLNGSILGMKRAEIARQFDQIVDFAEIEQFLDTPVKRYSSGMYVRLAFAVAAHLQPEILIVDEVLAVGDAQFQTKCLGKMEEVATAGRTVFLVSHQMNVVQRLCKTALLLDRGHLIASGDKDEVVARYLLSGPKALAPEDWFDLTKAPRTGTGEARFTAVRYAVGDGKRSPFAQSDGPLEVEMKIDSPIRRTLVEVSVTISDRFGTKLVHANSRDHNRPILIQSGINQITLRIDQLHLNPNTYVVGVAMEDIEDLLDGVPAAFQLEVRHLGAEQTERQRRRGGFVTCTFHVTGC
jgi:ABC-type polysaccharide/polyol phosphate transport system ATPase subunit